MTQVIGCSMDLGKEIQCPHHKPGQTCHNERCRFYEFCRQADGEFGDEAQSK